MALSFTHKAQKGYSIGTRTVLLWWACIERERPCDSNESGALFRFLAVSLPERATP
jgi:hypothetical protein